MWAFLSASEVEVLVRHAFGDSLGLVLDEGSISTFCNLKWWAWNWSLWDLLLLNNLLDNFDSLLLDDLWLLLNNLNCLLHDLLVMNLRWLLDDLLMLLDHTLHSSSLLIDNILDVLHL